MNVTNANAAFLSNYEVLKHLQMLRDGTKKEKRHTQLATITYETIRYLEGTPCNEQTEESITACLKALEPFNLRKNEKLMIINFPPTTPLEIQLLVEESEERLTEEKVAELLKIVATKFPHIQKEEEDEENTVEDG